jgi:hypothetical protein
MNQLATAVNITGWEAILVLFLIGGGFLLGLLLGRDRIFLLLIGSYISYALMCVVPFKKFFPDLFDQEGNFVILIVIFLVLIGLIYFLLSRSLLKTAIRKKGRRSLFQVFFLSLFLIGVVISGVFSYLPKDLISQFSSIILKIFNTPLARTLWLVIPLIFIGLFRRRGRRYGSEV